MCFYALAADFAAGGVAPALPIMEFQFQPHTPISKLTQLIAVSVHAYNFVGKDESEPKLTSFIVH
jgi:hypothetical protein